MEKGNIPLSVPNMAGNEAKYVLEAVEAGWVSTVGSFVERFEREFATYLNVSGAVACQSGTAALHLALLAGDVGRRDEVIVPTLTFIAAVNPVRYVGANPVFMDCDDSLCMDPVKLEKFCREECILQRIGVPEGNAATGGGSKGREDVGSPELRLINKKSGRHVKAIIVVHVFGNMADMDAICAVAEKYHLTVIEDATEALGTRYAANGTHHEIGAYAGTIGDIGAYSFNGNKIITTGGGGMVVAKDSAILKKIKYLSTQAKDDEVRFIHHEIGYNYRMTNVQAAIGVAQLEQLEKFIEIKKENYENYLKLGIPLLPFRQGIRPNYWFYSYLCTDLPTPLSSELDLVESSELSLKSLKKEKLFGEIVRQGIQVRPVWGLIHEQKPYANYQAYEIEKANHYFDSIINLPCSSNLTEQDVRYVAEKLISVM